MKKLKKFFVFFILVSTLCMGMNFKAFATDSKNKLVDANQDGIVNSFDASNIQYGDINKDGEINSLDVLQILRAAKGIYTLDEMDTIIADVNIDGIVNEFDAIIVLKHILGIKEFDTLPIISAKSGDVDCNGRVNSKDRAILSRYLEGWEGYELNEIQKLNADVNLDGNVDMLDRDILARHIAGWTGYETLPIVD